jgi:hypothetical protein
VLRQQPLALAGVLGEHGSLGLELGLYIHVKVGLDSLFSRSTPPIGSMK